MSEDRLRLKKKMATRQAIAEAAFELGWNEAQEVLDKLAEDFPVASGGQGSFIFEVPKGKQVDDVAKYRVSDKHN